MTSHPSPLAQGAASTTLRQAFTGIGDAIRSASAGHPGWGHYDACPIARGDHPDNDDCICDQMAAEYEDERDEQ